MSSRGSGCGGDASEAGEGLGVGELGAAVTDLGEEGGGADGAAVWQGPEDVTVWVLVEELGHVLFERVGLFDDRLDDIEVGEGHRSTGSGVGTVGSGWCGDELGVESGWGAFHVVAGGAEPVLEPLFGEPLGGVGCGEAPDEPSRCLAVDVGEQPDDAGEVDQQVSADLVSNGDPGVDETAAGADVGSQSDRCWSCSSLSLPRCHR